MQVIDSFGGEYSFLSNFHKCKVEFEGMTYPSVEHAFQAAKNPDPEEVKYEISDFLYHMMVLMADKGVTWEDITRELANR